MTHSPDPQLCTMSDAEESFRNELAAVYPHVEFEIAHLWQDRWMVAKSRRVCVEYKQDRKTRTESYGVEVDDRTEYASKLKDALRALESVGMECES